MAGDLDRARMPAAIWDEALALAGTVGVYQTPPLCQDEVRQVPPSNFR